MLDSAHPTLLGVAPEALLGSFIFCGNDTLVKDVMVGGRFVVRDRQHLAQAAIGARYTQALAELRAHRA